MKEIISKLVEVAKSRLLDKFPDQTPTLEEIRYWVEKSYDFTEIQGDRNNICTKATKQIDDDYQIMINKPTIITGSENKPWLHTREIDLKRTRRYRNYLVEDGKIPSPVIEQIFSSTDSILDLLADPIQGDDFCKRGLVVGHVQSGKTANYTALINKAMDVGYKFIILIAGVNNILRTQTQVRINKEVIGCDSLIPQNKIGVGDMKEYSSIQEPVAFTNMENDFSISALRTVGNYDPSKGQQPCILVIKKNSHVLKSVIRWVDNHKDNIDYPILLIDDEADNASINTKKNPQESTRINGQIREILQFFKQSCYVGFTATPFANIFIDPEETEDMIGDDLFPKDFIFALTAPSNYIGPKTYFLEEENEQYIRFIRDNENCIPIKPPAEHTITELPQSCEEAIDLFLLTIGIKALRQIGSIHTSMLINISHKQCFHSQIAELVKPYLKKKLRAIRYEKYDPFMEKLFIKEFADSKFDFRSVLEKINSLHQSIKVATINHTSKDKLNYPDYEDNTGLHVIAVGGYTLSRGFTLEGLTVTYLIRNSKMYDTLLQMGRWFGYRNGYEDLCRLYLTPESFEWYAHISEALEELHDEIGIMQKHKLTPRDYGLKVRSHPASLMVTARNKMHTATKQIDYISYSERLYQTEKLSIDQNIICRNNKLIKSFFANIGNWEEPEEAKGLLWRSINKKTVMDFLKKFTVDQDDVDNRFLQAYIENTNSVKLNFWDIYFVTREGTAGELEPENRPIDNIFVRKQKRTLPKVSENYISLIGGGGRLVRIWEEKVGLSSKQEEKAEQERKESNIKQTARFYRKNRCNPLLIIKFLEVSIKNSLNETYTLPAYGISFPKLENIGKEYMVNSTWEERRKLLENMLINQFDDDEELEIED